VLKHNYKHCQTFYLANTYSDKSKNRAPGEEKRKDMQVVARKLVEKIITSPKQRPAHVHISYALTLPIKPTS
jgi:hypothetical protein